ncbi:MAG: hypothetical protein ACK4FG_06185 [Brevundimonas sp.]
MSNPLLIGLFGLTWLAGMAYGLSAWRLLAAVQAAQARGVAPDAPNVLAEPWRIFEYLKWLVTGRYGEVEDDAVRRWAGITQPLFFLAGPLILGMFAAVGLGLVQPT